ncbi:pentapeptide repeat-containing protein [Actinophytocola sp. KF-1]
MGEWAAPVLWGLGAGVLVAVWAFAFRRAAPAWTAGGRLAVLIVVAVVLGAAVPVTVRSSGSQHAEQADDRLARLAARLDSADLGERLTALEELFRLVDHPSSVPRIVAMLSEFVRERAPKAGDPRCAGSEPAQDVASALSVLGARAQPGSGVVVDLRGTCLVHARLGSFSAPGGTFADADLSGARLNAADLTGADLARANLSGASLAGTNLVDTRLVDARFADTDLRGAHFSDDTLWPPWREEAVMAASSFATTTFVIGELVLSDPR